MIRVNDKWDIPWHNSMTVQDVLDTCEFTHRHIVVSINAVLVLPEEYATHLVADEDQIRVVHIIGGG